MRTHRKVTQVSNIYEEGRCIIFCVSKTLWHCVDIDEDWMERLCLHIRSFIP